MNNKTYKDLLQDDRWKRKSLKIRNRDFHTCQHCGVKNVELHVHHKRYYKGKPPWDIQDEYLITLCHLCHKKEHEGKDISSFVYVSKKKEEKLNRKNKRREQRKNKYVLFDKPYTPPTEERRIISQSELKLKLEEHQRYKDRIKIEVENEPITPRRRTKGMIRKNARKRVYVLKRK